MTKTVKKVMNLQKDFLSKLTLLLFIFFIPAIVLAQKQQIKGTVFEAETDETLIGVSVVNKSAATGMTTNINGEFSIAASEGDTIRFSYLGFKPYEYKVPAKAETSLKITLQHDSKVLQEVVIEAGIIQRERAGFT